MILWFYNLALWLGFPVILAILLSKARCRPGLPARLGLVLPEPPTPDAENPRTTSNAIGTAPTIWIHAVSLGEVVAVVPLVKALHRADPRRRLVVSTVTETGREAVLTRLAGVASHCYAPLDYAGIVRRLIRHIRPSIYVCVETELWPNLLRVMEEEAVPTVLVNGRISSRSFARQQWPVVRTVYRQLLRRLTLCLMQTPRDADRAVALGAEPTHVRCVGNIKFDQPTAVLPDQQMAPIRQWIEALPGSPVLLAGSTHVGEEEMLIDAVRTLRATYPKLRVIVAPRHIERTDDVIARCAAQGIVAQRRSRLRVAPDTTSEKADQSASWLLLLDTRGELGAAYRYADIAFVGGTLVPIGGHNVLEPAVWGRPVLFGPYTDHCEESARALEQSGGGVRVADAAALVAQVDQWLRQQEARTSAGLQAKATIDANRGALDACLKAIEQILREKPGHTQPAAVCADEQQDTVRRATRSDREAATSVSQGQHP
ncbi:MAG: 3-deoxy-D-manno-octulosonic acid transferase [Nitrospiraceae bacterium]